MIRAWSYCRMQRHVVPARDAPHADGADVDPLAGRVLAEDRPARSSETRLRPPLRTRLQEIAPRNPASALHVLLSVLCHSANFKPILCSTRIYFASGCPVKETKPARSFASPRPGALRIAPAKSPGRKFGGHIGLTIAPYFHALYGNVMVGNGTKRIGRPEFTALEFSVFSSAERQRQHHCGPDSCGADCPGRRTRRKVSGCVTGCSEEYGLLKHSIASG